MKNDKSDTTPATLATRATNWERLEPPSNFDEAALLATKILTARLNTAPRAKWRIRIDRPNGGTKPEFWLSTSNDGCTRAEFFQQLASPNYVHSVKNMAMAARLLKEEQAQSSPKKGRSKREIADLQRPAGQSLDTVIFGTCKLLAALDWKPLSRAAHSGAETSVFDAVAKAMVNLKRAPNSYEGARDAYYRVSEKVTHSQENQS